MKDDDPRIILPDGLGDFRPAAGHLLIGRGSGGTLLIGRAAGYCIKGDTILEKVYPQLLIFTLEDPSSFSLPGLTPAILILAGGLPYDHDPLPEIPIGFHFGSKGRFIKTTGGT